MADGALISYLTRHAMVPLRVRKAAASASSVYQVCAHPPNQGLGIYPFLGLQLGGPPGPPGVLFGGHKGQFGSWGALQSVVASFHKLQLIVVHVWPTNTLHMLVH